jgi:hypothetical protein
MLSEGGPTDGRWPGAMRTRSRLTAA